MVLNSSKLRVEGLSQFKVDSLELKLYIATIERVKRST